MNFTSYSAIMATNDFGFMQQTSEYDANSALSELDRALRSNNIGEKAELIVRVPNYFEKYPFPIFVNAVLLKLTELFKNSTTNFLRKLVLQVAKRSQTHLDKIISRDEIAKRIFVVSYSNDHIARSLALRFLGYLSNILSDRKEIHHLVRTGLDSNDFTELDASIFAAERFASQSKEFANSIAGKVLEMLSSVDVSSDTKVKVLPILEHVHNDPHTTQKVFEICIETLKSCDYDLQFVCTVLKTLTSLSLSSFMILEAQVNYLYSILDSAYPFVVKKQAFISLADIAVKAPHFLNDSHFLKSLDIAQKLNSASKSEAKLLLFALKFMSDLANSKLIMTWSNFDKIFNSLTFLVNKNMLLFRNDSYSILSRISVVSANLMLNMDQESNNQALTVDFLIRFLPSWNWPDFDTNASPDPATKMLLRSLIRICSRYPQFSIRVSEALFSAARIIPACYSNLLTETFCALNDCDHRVISKIGREFAKQYASLSPYIALLIYDTIVDDNDGERDPWILYKLARFASRHARHKAAAKMFERLLNRTYSDTNYNWLKFLAKFSAVEANVISDQFSTSSLISAYISASDCFAISSYAMDQVGHLIQKYESLIVNSFDADPKTLRHLSLEKTKMILIKQNLRFIAGSKPTDAEKFMIVENSSDNYCAKDAVAFLNNVNRDFMDLTENLVDESAFYQVIETVVALIHKLIRRPLYVPRYFYQALQSTTVKLALTPQPSLASDQSVALMPGQGLMVKVEGIIQISGPKEGFVRRISKVQLTLCTEFSDIPCIDEKDASMDHKLISTLTPHNNYFSAEFVLNFPRVNNLFLDKIWVLLNHFVNISKSGSLKVDAHLIDEETNHLWTLSNVGERLKIKCLAPFSNSSSLLSSNLSARFAI